MTEDEHPKRSLADDPNFFDSLSDLDRGLTAEASSRNPRSPVPPAAVSLPDEYSPPVAAAPPVAPGGSSRAPRRLLDLFPPTTDSSEEPLILEPLPAVERRSTPLVKAPRQSPQPLSAPPSQGAPGYQTFYGLQEPPFSLSSDPRFLYHSTAHDRAAQAMLDAIRRRDGIVVLTGAVGVGKTMLCHAIVEQLDRRTLTSLVADPFVAPEDLLKTVLVDFGVISAADMARGKLAKATLADLSAALRDFLYTLAPLQAFAVVIIDNAQKISVQLLEQIRLLADTGGEEQLLQVMLVGQPPLTSTLSKPELKQLFKRVTARSSLGTLKPDEIAGYIEHRLKMAGTSPRVEFDEDSLTRLYELSGGVPRVLNLLCERALISGYKASVGTIDVRMVNAAAEDLDLAPPVAKRSLIHLAGFVAAILVLVMLGAAAGAFVFRTRVAAVLDQWESEPAPPQQPQPVLPSPYSPMPAIDAERAAHDLM